MNSTFKIIFFLGIILSQLVVNAQHPMQAVNQQIRDSISRSGASIAVAFKDLQTGNTLYINEKKTYHAASTMKFPVLIELYKQAAENRYSLTDSLVLNNSFKSIADSSRYSLNDSDDTETGLYRKLGRKIAIKDLAYLMITKSSNLATNTLIQLVRPAGIMQTLRQLGANDTRVLRGVEDQKAYDKGLNNTTTAFDLALLYEQLAKKELVSEKADQSMIKILMDQQLNEVIPALLPENVKVAHKTGNIEGLQHDSGIVFLPDGRKYVLVLLSTFRPDQTRDAISTLAHISKLIYDAETAQKD
ncbi:serine hydrolase [Niabella ginsenosidivorans]|uniref:beta-lactamase n=1 Tax=Niabella ginsenosidivorans TaxID=1176587 RepID=A0A1A9I484_9BACT|nr:serine hydrolase [Niabella ginsenosidivorans]ANH82125.1 serine hydrolase [Niabella ginsenosidivorans]